MCKNIPNCKTGVFLKIKIRLSFNIIFRHKLHWLNKFNNTLLYSTYRFSLQCGFSRGKMMHKIGTCQSVGSSRSTFKNGSNKNRDCKKWNLWKRAPLEQTPNDAPFQFILRCILREILIFFLCALHTVESLVTFDHV